MHCGTGRVVMWKTPGWTAKIGNKLSPPSLDAEISDEAIWAPGYSPHGNEAVYSLIASYAEKQYDDILDHFDIIDKKADEHLRFMTAAVGAVIALTASKLVIVAHSWLAVLGVVLILVAFVIAMIARTPMSGSFPMTPRDMLAIADLETNPSKHQMESVIVASYQVAITGMRKAVEWKSGLVRVAMYLCYAGFGLLLWSLLPI